MKTFACRMMLLVLVGLMAWMNGNAQTVINGGEVSGKWTKANSPYQVNDNITVAQGTTLEIEPGVTVAFANNVGLTINGQLTAEGTENDSIIFTRQSDNWGGLTFSAAGESESVVKYASIEYVNKSGYGGVSITAGTVTLSNNMISNNTASVSTTISNSSCGGGVYIGGGTVTLSDNNISDNTASANSSYSTYSYGGGIYIALGTVILSNNMISNNTASVNSTYTSDSYGGGVYIGGGTVALSDNTISNNTASTSTFYSSYSYGGGVYIGGGAVTLSDNTISNNTASANSSANISSYGGGIYMDKSTVNMYNNIISGNSAISAGGGVYVSNMIAGIRNNVISNNKHAASKSGNGGGISLYNSSSMIINNTIAYNDAENGGGMYCAAGSSPVVIDNILYGNTSSLESQVFINDNNSAPKMLYNLNQCGCLGYAAGVNYNWDANYDASNFDANPQFVNYALQNYRLKETSPCINAGIEDVTGLGLPNADIDGNIRIYGGRIDIGAYEYGAPTGIDHVTVQNRLMIYPNPSRDGIFQLAMDNNEVNWTVYDIKGKQISQGNTAWVDLSFCQKGIYVIKVQTGKDIVSAKLVKL